MSRTCLVIGAAKDRLDRAFIDGSLDLSEGRPYIYCADGGLQNAETVGLKPDKLIGDMDSAGDAYVKTAPISTTGEVVWLPQEKDETDLFACVADGLKNGFDRFILLFCTNGRIDHFMGAAAILEYLDGQGAHGIILDSQNEISFIGPGHWDIRRDERFRYLSIIPLDRMLTGITLSGVKYPLKDATVRRQDMCLLISNEITAAAAVVETEQGRALLIKSRDLR